MNRKSFLKTCFASLVAAKLAIQCGASEINQTIFPNSNKLPEGYVRVFDPHPLRFGFNEAMDGYEHIPEYENSLRNNPAWNSAPFELVPCRESCASKEILGVMVRRVIQPYGDLNMWRAILKDASQPLYTYR